jgi:hypothetical protein
MKQTTGQEETTNPPRRQDPGRCGKVDNILSTLDGENIMEYHIVGDTHAQSEQQLKLTGL